MKPNFLVVAASVAVLQLVIGCASQDKVEYVGTVDALSSVDTAIKIEGVELSPELQRRGLEAQFLEEMAKRSTLIYDAKHQHIQDRDSVTLLIDASVSEPKTKSYSYSLPTYGQTGIASSSTFGNFSASSYGGTYSSNTYNTPSFGVTGYQQHSGTYTVYDRSLTMRAVSVNSDEVRAEVRVTSQGSSPSLRRLFPYLLAAGAKELGSTTLDGPVPFTLEETDATAAMIRGETFGASESTDQ